jgi:Ca2+-binding RTX toxin-like protein
MLELGGADHPRAYGRKGALMRRILNGRTKLFGLLTAMGLLLLVLAAGVALAQPEPPPITCTGGVCQGTQGPDLIFGTNDDDLIVAKGGTDGANGQGGNDHVLGGPGNDSPGSSPSGHDPRYHLEGGAGDDTVSGGPGIDSVMDRFGPLLGFPADTDRLFGGPDNDFLNGLDRDGLDHLDCGPGEDEYAADPGDTVRDNCETNVAP